MKRIDLLRKILPTVKEYSTEYYLIKEIVENWGHWKRRPSPGAFNKGYDARRKTNEPRD